MPDKSFSPGSGEDIGLGVYNPYDFDIELKKVEFGLFYLNDYKKVIEFYPVRQTPDQKNIGP